jgi:23S rRNA pseudouridine1911/1915/1917 synthase
VIEELPAALDGERLDRVVSMLTGVSRSDAAALVLAGEVRVNGEPVTTKTHRLVEGDEIELVVTGTSPVALEPDPTVAFRTVYEDADLVVVDKPAGLVVHPGAGTPGGTLANGLLVRYPELADVGEPGRPGIVHRLDKGTSGLLLVARSPRAYDSLVAALAGHEVERDYVALVWGTFDSKAGMIDAPIGRSPRSPTRMTVSARGRDARTHYAVRQEFHDPVDVSLLDCRLETGRTHQIRVHLAAIDHPVVGDERYRGARQSLPVPRPFLHAQRLRFAHPITGDEMEFASPLPDDLRAVLATLA